MSERLQKEGNPLRPGMGVNGFCAGAFGRDSYENRIVEATGPDWIVTRDENGEAEFVSGDDLFLAFEDRDNAT